MVIHNCEILFPKGWLPKVIGKYNLNVRFPQICNTETKFCHMCLLLCDYTTFSINAIKFEFLFLQVALTIPCMEEESLETSHSLWLLELD